MDGSKIWKCYHSDHPFVLLILQMKKINLLTQQRTETQRETSPNWISMVPICRRLHHSYHSSLRTNPTSSLWRQVKVDPCWPCLPKSDWVTVLVLLTCIDLARLYGFRPPPHPLTKPSSRRYHRSVRSLQRRLRTKRKCNLNLVIKTWRWNCWDGTRTWTWTRKIRWYRSFGMRDTKPTW